MKHYSTLASLFSYPNYNLENEVAEIKANISKYYPENLGKY